VKIQNIEIQNIKPYKNNPRKISQKSIDMVAQSIEEFGYQQPIVVDKHNIIVVGHTRHQASLKLGLTHVPVVVGDFTEEQAKAYRIADNRINEETGWDSKALQEELNALMDLDMDLNLTGFSSEELDQLFAKQEIQIEPYLPENDMIGNEQHDLNDVRMIQLFYPPEDEQRFRSIIEKVREKTNATNISEAVMLCVLNEEKRIKD